MLPEGLEQMLVFSFPIIDVIAIVFAEQLIINSGYAKNVLEFVINSLLFLFPSYLQATASITYAYYLFEISQWRSLSVNLLKILFKEVSDVFFL